MRQQYKPVLIFSVYQSTDTKANNKTEHLNMLEFLKQEGISFRECLGSYRGETELAFIVDAVHAAEILTIAYQHKQDSVLYLDQDRNAELIFPCDKRPNERIGVFKTVSPKTARELESWTADLDTGLFYAAS